MTDPSKARSILPIDKQYLVTRNVPCAERVVDMEQALMGETEMEIANILLDANTADGSEPDGWLMSHVSKEVKATEDDFDFVTMDGQGNVVSFVQPDSTAHTQQSKEDDEYGDMAEFEDNNLANDEALALDTCASGGDNIQRVRTYDISITYDKYYQTPRVWIFGYSEDGSTPLTPTQMFEDVMSDYVQRTVTMETHPHVSGPHLSVHPCQHGAVMKNIVRNLTKDEDAKAPSVEMYLFIFLKFVSSIIPTMNYDFTFDVTASTHK